MTSAIRKPEGDPHDGVDAWLERNKDALDEAVKSAREQVARGEHDPRTMDDIIADGERRYRARRTGR